MFTKSQKRDTEKHQLDQTIKITILRFYNQCELPKDITNWFTFHVSLSLPKYPVNAFCPHGQLTGLQIGAKADTDCQE